MQFMLQMFNPALSCNRFQLPPLYLPVRHQLVCMLLIAALCRNSMTMGSSAACLHVASGRLQLAGHFRSRSSLV
jgi:hypothetical protein